MISLDDIRRVLDAHAKLRVPAASIEPNDDLYTAGMTSHASVNVMLALEDAFEVEFPDDLLTKTTFCTISAIGAALDTLVAVDA
jgi:acyl carrier protein